MTFPLRTAPAVGVIEAMAFVAIMRRIEDYAALRRGWNGDGAEPIRAPAIKAARKLIEARQRSASRFTPMPHPGGGICLSFAQGVHEGHGGKDTHRIDICRQGKPTIVQIGNEENGRAFPSVSDAKFRKALDDLISPRTGRIKTKKIEIDGIVFASEIEGRRYLMLRQEQRLGLISDLRLQTPYPYIENRAKCFTYYADFNYRRDGREIVEDVKGMRTEIYRLKKKLIEARYGIVITEWPKSRKQIKREAEAAERAEKKRRQREEIEARKAARLEARLKHEAAKQEKRLKRIAALPLPKGRQTKRLAASKEIGL